MSSSRPPFSRSVRAAHLVTAEGVTADEADAFLDVADAALDEDPEHALLDALDERILASRMAESLRRIATARDSRVGAGDVARLQAAAVAATEGL